MSHSSTLVDSPSEKNRLFKGLENEFYFSSCSVKDPADVAGKRYGEITNVALEKDKRPDSTELTFDRGMPHTQQCGEGM